MRFRLKLETIMLRKLYAIILLFLTMTLIGYENNIVARRAQEKITVDGNLDELIWKQEALSSLTMRKLHTFFSWFIS